MTDTAPPATEELPLQHERLTARLFRSALIGVISVAIGYISVARRIALVPLLETAAAYIAVLTAVIVVTAIVQRRRGGQSLRFTPGALEVPGRGMAGTRTIPYSNIRAANLAGRSFFTALSIDTGDRIAAFSLKRLGGPPGAARFFQLLQPRILALPDGAARWAKINTLRTRAEVLRVHPAWATRAIALAITTIFALQLAWPRLTGRADDGFGAIDLGGNAAVLVAHGQWWRLITASLLHGSPQHLLNNLIFLLVFGTLLERLIGVQRTLLVVLVTGIASQAVSALAAPYTGAYLYSVGISGALFGLIGALGALTWRMGNDMPAGFRLPRTAWVLLLGLNLAVGLAIAQVDKSAHAGGLLAGAVLGWLLMRVGGSHATLDELRAPTPLIPIAVAGFAAIWLVAIAAQCAHEANAGAPLADRMALANTQTTRADVQPAVLNALAWAIALQPRASRGDLQTARILSARAVDASRQVQNLYRYYAAFADTLAVLTDRLGDSDGALRLQATLLHANGQQIAIHMADMLQRRLASQGRLQIGAPMSVPTLRLQDGTLRFAAPDAVPQGGHVVALLRRNGSVRGVLDMYVPPGFSGEQILPLPVNYGAPRITAPDAIWLDGASSIEVALFDATGCHCQWPSMAPWWHPLATEPTP